MPESKSVPEQALKRIADLETILMVIITEINAENQDLEGYFNYLAEDPMNKHLRELGLPQFIPYTTPNEDDYLKL